MSFTPNIEFLVVCINKSENRGSESIKEKGMATSYSVGLVDNKKKKEFDKQEWSPMSRVDMRIIDTETSGLEFGKKYKITFEEIK